MLALALQEYEDSLCPGCGQTVAESMDPDLADEWDYMPPQRCHGCTALARAADAAEKNKVDHPGALRWVIGLKHGWEARRAMSVAARAERSASGEHGDHAEHGHQ